jgi:hypothetical protein
MTIKLVFLVTMLTTNASSIAQTVDDFLLDFSVPDMPAFKALGSDPSEILRPSDLKKFGVMMQAFRSEGSTIIPRSFSLEVAPWKLMKGDWTIDEYQDKGIKRILYNSSLSLGTINSDENKVARRVSIGLRTTFMGKNSDILRSSFIDKIYANQADVLKARIMEKERWFSDKGYDIAAATDQQNSDFDKYWEDYSRENGIFTNTKALVESFNDDHWNDTRFDIAIAWVGASPDSLVKNLNANNFLVWATAAIKPGKNNDHGQLLIGINYQRPRTGVGETEPNTKFTGNLRYYEGTQNFRGFLEFQYKVEKQMEIETGLLNLGAELRVKQDFWLVFSAGVDDVFKEGAESDFVSSIDIRYSFNN